VASHHSSYKQNAKGFPPTLELPFYSPYHSEKLESPFLQWIGGMEF
jgi:hypothetical protein